MNFWGWLLKKRGWTFRLNIDPPRKCVVCVAPHTSNWDFILGEVCIRSVGKTASFLMKDTWFFFPLGLFLKGIGGVPVKRQKHTHVTDNVIAMFNSKEDLWVAVTPEGTRSRNPLWRKGFLHIAREAQVPIVLAVFDYGRRIVLIDRVLTPSDDPDHDLNEIKHYFASFPDAAKFPQNFAIE